MRSWTASGPCASVDRTCAPAVSPCSRTGNRKGDPMTRLHRMINARMLGVVLLLTASCAKDLPTAPTTPDPQHGAPTKIDLTFTDGFGEHAGTATLIAHVIDAFAAAVPDVPVTFDAETGTLADSLVKTDDKGNATTTLTADPGSVRVHARVSDSVTTMTLVAVQAKPVP